MALQTWRLIGVSATIAIYIGGVIFLSMNNVPGPHPKRFHIERFGEIPGFRSQRLSNINRKMTIHWCKKLHFLNAKLPSNNVKNSLSSQYYSHNFSQASNNGMNTSHFRQFSSTGLTALASFPGSGNTWLRYLLQQSTGILTGSIYIDYGLLKTGFPGENVANNSVLVVKTHEWGPNAWTPFSKAILLVRDPEKALLAEFNRRSGGHIGFASPDRYKRTKGTYWQQFVTKNLKGWEIFNLAWAMNFTGSVKVVFYDELVNNLEHALRDILNFLEFPIDETLLSCALTRKEGIFRRKKRILSFDPFTPAMKSEIILRQQKVYTLLEKYS